MILWPQVKPFLSSCFQCGKLARKCLKFSKFYIFGSNMQSCYCKNFVVRLYSQNTHKFDGEEGGGGKGGTSHLSGYSPRSLHTLVAPKSK